MSTLYTTYRRQACLCVARRQAGLSLVETLVVLALFSILSIAIMNAVASFYRQNAYTIAQSYQVSEARRGVERMVRDLREMTYADNGAYPIIETSTSTIRFYSDIDRDDSVERVSYELDDTTLYKRIYNATGTPPTYDATPDTEETISEYVQNNPQDRVVFTYYNATGTEMAATGTVTDIRHVDVQLIVNIDPVRDPGEFMLRSSATLRNLKEDI